MSYREIAGEHTMSRGDISLLEQGLVKIDEITPGPEFTITFGPYRGMKLCEIEASELEEYANELYEKLKNGDKRINALRTQKLLQAIKEYGEIYGAFF